MIYTSSPDTYTLKNERKCLSFHIPNIGLNVNHFAKVFHEAQTFFFLLKNAVLCLVYV